MKASLGVVVAVLLWVVPPASAHRLDEFLQATTIAVEKTRVTVQLRLTPGVAVARTVLADLDADGNGIVSDAEQRAYVERVLRDLSLAIDGSRLRLRLASASFPPIEEIKAGLGDILLTFRADVPRGGLNRRLIFKNQYQSGMAAYLVNCLFPDDPEICVSAQDRNYEQSFYQVDYTQAGNADPIPAPSTSKPTIGRTGGQSN